MVLPNSVEGSIFTAVVWNEESKQCFVGGVGEALPPTGEGEGPGSEGGVRNASGPVFLGPVVTLELRDPSTGQEVSELPPGEEILFWLPLSNGYETMDESFCTPSGPQVQPLPTCSFYDQDQQAWSTAGCRPVSGQVSVIPGSEEQLGLECACTHLTEFAVLEEEVQSGTLCAVDPTFFVFGLMHAFGM